MYGRAPTMGTPCSTQKQHRKEMLDAIARNLLRATTSHMVWKGAPKYDVYYDTR